MTTRHKVALTVMVISIGLLSYVNVFDPNPNTDLSMRVLSETFYLALLFRSVCVSFGILDWWWR
jgi:hypothetical protein